MGTTHSGRPIRKSVIRFSFSKGNENLCDCVHLYSYVYAHARTHTQMLAIGIGCDSYLVDDAVDHRHLVNGLHLCFSKKRNQFGREEKGGGGVRKESEKNH